MAADQPSAELEVSCQEDDDHDWEYISDWYGDPGVINGTCNFYYRRCRTCGKEDQWDGSDAGEFDDNYI